MGYRVDWEGQGVLVEYFDHVTADEMRESVETVNAHPGFDDLKYRINDFRRVTSYAYDPLDAEVIGAISWAASLNKRRGVLRARIASVTTDPRIASDLSAYHRQETVPRYPFTVVSTMEEARAWVTQAEPTPAG